LEEQARALIADHLGASVSMVVDDASLPALGADSLDLVSLTMALEEAFDVRISDDQAEGCGTVGDVIRLLRERCAARTTAVRLHFADA
jgi:acyl carrier protein